MLLRRPQRKKLIKRCLFIICIAHEMCPLSFTTHLTITYLPCVPTDSTAFYFVFIASLGGKLCNLNRIYLISFIQISRTKFYHVSFMFWYIYIYIYIQDTFTSLLKFWNIFLCFLMLLAYITFIICKEI